MVLLVATIHTNSNVQRRRTNLGTFDASFAEFSDEEVDRILLQFLTRGLFLDNLRHERDLADSGRLAATRLL